MLSFAKRHEKLHDRRWAPSSRWTFSVRNSCYCCGWRGRESLWSQHFLVGPCCWEVPQSAGLQSCGVSYRERARARTQQILIIICHYCFQSHTWLETTVRFVQWAVRSMFLLGSERFYIWQLDWSQRCLLAVYFDLDSPTNLTCSWNWTQNPGSNQYGDSLRATK